MARIVVKYGDELIPLSIPTADVDYIMQHLAQVESNLAAAVTEIDGELDALASSISQETTNRNVAITDAISAHNTSSSAHSDIRTVLNTLARMPLWDSDNYILTFTNGDGAVIEIDLPIETLLAAWDFDEETNQFIITREDGSKIYIDSHALISVYTGSTGEQIIINVGTDNVISATIRPASISEDLLTAELAQKVNYAPTTLPPSGAAGGDLTGNYPNPELASGRVFTGKSDPVISEMRNGDIYFQLD